MLDQQRPNCYCVHHGNGLALPFSDSSARLAAHLTMKDNSIREAEVRFGVMLSAMLIDPAGLVVYGTIAQLKLHRLGSFAGVAMLDRSALFYFTFILPYAMDLYKPNMSEMLIAMDVAENAISFCMGYALLTRVPKTGYAAVIAGAFGGILVADNLVLLLLIWTGKSMWTYCAVS